MHISTELIHGYGTNPLGAVSPPVFLSSAFANAEQNGYSYSRCTNPTRETLEKTIAKAEKGKYGFAFSSGLAAEDAVFTLCNRIVCANQIYGGTKRLLNAISAEVIFADMSNLNEVEAAVDGKKCLIFAESPSNPLLTVCDIRAIAQIAHSVNGILAIDNTFMTPVFQRPLELGADVAVHSATKYLCGHHDAIAGCAVTNDGGIAEKLFFAVYTKGYGLSPFDSFLVRRGMETLEMRMKKHDENGRKVFDFLSSSKNVGKIYYPGDKSCGGYEIHTSQALGFGGMISFEMANAHEFIKSISKSDFILFAESLGGNATLVTHPYTQTHASLTKEEKERNHITPNLLRLSVGTEDIDDILGELCCF